MAKKLVKYVSNSQISTFLDCELKYYHQYIEGLKDTSSNEYFAYGSAIHFALSHNYQQKIASRKDLDIAQITNVFTGYFDDETKHLHCSKGVLQQMRSIGIDVLTKYMVEIAPTIQPIQVEWKVELSLKNYPITLLCIMDVVTEDGYIIDHKTSGPNYIRQWNQATVNSSMQLTLYAAAYRKSFKTKEKGVQIHVLPREYSPNFGIFTSQRTDEQVHQALHLASAIEYQVEKGIFLPSTKNCFLCPFKTFCKKEPVIQPSL